MSAALCVTFNPYIDRILRLLQNCYPMKTLYDSAPRIWFGLVGFSKNIKEFANVGQAIYSAHSPPGSAAHIVSYFSVDNKDLFFECPMGTF